jgi:hypothetical protein
MVATTMFASRHFGRVARIMPDGTAILRRFRGPDAVLDQIGALSLGSALRVGALLEFDVYEREDASGIRRAHSACTLQDGQRRADRNGNSGAAGPGAGAPLLPGGGTVAEAAE